MTKLSLGDVAEMIERLKEKGDSRYLEVIKKGVTDIGERLLSLMNGEENFKKDKGKTNKIRKPANTIDDTLYAIRKRLRLNIKSFEECQRLCEILVARLIDNMEHLEAGQNEILTVRQKLSGIFDDWHKTKIPFDIEAVRSKYDELLVHFIDNYGVEDKLGG